jgi:lysophospholipase L1-like esterase
LNRRIVKAGAVTTFGWWAGATYLRWHRLPSFEGANASGVWGDDSLPPLSIVVLGDSSCTGPGLDSIDDVWVRRVGRELGARFHITIDSLAVGGSKAGDVLAGQVPRAVASFHDVAIVSVGPNDMLRGISASTFRRQLGEIVDALTPVSRAVVLSGVGDMATIPRLPLFVRPLAHARALAADRAHAEIAARRSNVFKVPIWDRAPEFRTDPLLWSPDLFHASSSGHAVYADAAMPSIEAAIDVVLTARRSENPTTR